MSFFDYIDTLEDNRTDINKEYELADIIFLTMAAVLSGAKGWKGINLFGVAQIDWLRQHRPFTNGIPTRHSIGRIIRGIKADSFTTCFVHWINQVRETQGRDHIAFDGKVLRGAKQDLESHPLQLMTAMVVESGLVIYQQETASKTNEIPIMQAMLSSMAIKGAVITADAMHCQTKTAAAIKEGQGDYVLQVKANQKKLLADIKGAFQQRDSEHPELREQDHYQELDGEHGRITERHYRLLPATTLSRAQKFKDCQAIVEVHRTRTIKNKQQQETSYYITSLTDTIDKVANVIRRHWKIENSQHWILDVVFREDECQIYAEDGARNLASMRRILLNMVKEHPLKDSVAGKFQRANWDLKFREEILFGHNLSKV